MEKKSGYDPKIHGRHTIRLPEYDYTNAGYYMITICTQDRKRLFGHIRNQKIKLNTLGEIARDELLKTPLLRPNVRIDEWIVMPDHVHVIFEIRNKCRGDARVAPTNPQIVECPRGPMRQSVGSIIGAFKSAVTKRIHSFKPDINVWQRNYYERILFDDGELEYYRTYIRDNPRNWGRESVDQDKLKAAAR